MHMTNEIKLTHATVRAIKAQARAATGLSRVHVEISSRIDADGESVNLMDMQDGHDLADKWDLRPGQKIPLPTHDRGIVIEVWIYEILGPGGYYDLQDKLKVHLDSSGHVVAFN